jgi:hypothetical protein
LGAVSWGEDEDIGDMAGDPEKFDDAFDKYDPVKNVYLICE